MRKLFVKLTIIFVISVFLLWLVTKTVITQIASHKAKGIIEAVYQKDKPTSDDEKIISLTSHVFQNFVNADPANDIGLRLRGYVTNKRLPVFFRLEGGVIETLVSKGQCDNAARMLAFILKQEGYHSVQWNIATKNDGHSALLVTLSEDRFGYVDPFLGYIAQDQGVLIHPVEANKTNKNKFIPLDKTKPHKFYESFKDFMMSAEGEELLIKSKIPFLKKKNLILGTIDGQFDDVRRDAKEQQLAQYWYYMGHKYNREWVRTLEAVEPVKITMTLVEAPDQKVITSNIKPDISGNSLIWVLQPGQKLSFTDGDAGVSLKRLNSFIGVDQIVFEKI